MRAATDRRQAVHVLLAQGMISPLWNWEFLVDWSFPDQYTFVAFFVIFELGNLISALAQSSGQIIGGRTVSGIGASGLTNGALVIITAACPPAVRPMASAAGISMIAIGGIFGPLLSGVLIRHAGWRWCKCSLSLKEAFYFSASYRYPAERPSQVSGFFYHQEASPLSSCCYCIFRSRPISLQCDPYSLCFQSSSTSSALPFSRLLALCFYSPSTGPARLTHGTRLRLLVCFAALQQLLAHLQLGLYTGKTTP